MHLKTFFASYLFLGLSQSYSSNEFFDEKTQTTKLHLEQNRTEIKKNNNNTYNIKININSQNSKKIKGYLPEGEEEEEFNPENLKKILLVDKYEQDKITLLDFLKK